MIIGSHVSMSAPDYLLGSVKDALSYDANALMVYTGAPQNTIRKSVASLKVEEAKELLKSNNIPFDRMVIHAPYIINLANTIRPETYDLAVSFLRQEIDRVTEIGATYLVLHPGSYVGATLEEGIASIIQGLNEVVKEDDDIIICLETMAGKGSEVGYCFEQIKLILDGVRYLNKYGVCLDTCHIHDAGYDVLNIDSVLEEFDRIIGLDKLYVVHLNDSKNIKGAKKDRHANLGQGEIGFEGLYQVAHHPLLEDKIMILETPWIDDQPPYKEEIMMLRK
ncbi:deoxyribonuclease IV [Anaerorhabdus sp.]|jgi:deoxyribonuclease IV|uniref:deoxyribonuclease IV n=1 Tax=Anaerorhabdus sp. TaxID=1872524 RepID=UPI002FCB8CE2